MILSLYSVVGLAVLMAAGFVLLALAFWPASLRTATREAVQGTASVWAQFRFGFPSYSLIFLSFDMEMIFMYPWAVVFRSIGLEAFLDMLVFIAILAAGLIYAYRLGGLEWE